jgi:hypothetical protein
MAGAVPAGLSSIVRGLEIEMLFQIFVTVLLFGNIDAVTYGSGSGELKNCLRSLKLAILKLN